MRLFHHLRGIRRCNQDLKRVAEVISHSGHVLVMAGAGLSVASGIPDFRTPGSGLYDNLRQVNDKKANQCLKKVFLFPRKYRLPYPEAIFDIDYFRHSPRAFNSWAKEYMFHGRFKPNEGHFFVYMLHSKGKLLRMYTQNVDGLELSAGLPEDKLVFAHGSFSSASCASCGEPETVDAVREALLADKDPICKKCGGFVKPDVVLFGEQLPERFKMHAEDAIFSDCLICIGTSLEVIDAGINRYR